MEEVKEKKKKIELSPKTKKILNIVVDVVCGVILVIALILAVSMINSRRKGYKDYTEIFGNAYLAVQTDSMKPTFSSGDMIKIKTVSENEAKDFKVGDIITFKDPMIVNGQYKLNTHRIIEVGTDSNGIYYTLRGDSKDVAASDTQTVRPNEVVGVYQGSAKSIGKLFLFMGTSAGFFVFVVLPTLIIVVFAAVNFALVLIREKKAQKAIAAQAQEEVLADERERIRQELLAEMRAQSSTAEVVPSEEEKVAEESVKAEEEVPTDKDEK